MGNLDFRQGYFKAMADMAEWVNRPNAPINRRLCAPRYLEQIIYYIIEHLDEFMACPDTFGFDFEIMKKRLIIRDAEVMPLGRNGVLAR